MATKPKNTQGNEKPKQAETGDWFVVSTTHRRPRRRAGLRITPEGVRVNGAELTDDAKQAIADDPFLKIKPAEAPEKTQADEE